ncbi:hypothetical protein ANCDUO_00059 [Ancylostoma duodenale]|uniref:Uncharacterized protein n=1 Tax=Ancylostoma duodenale TaxID=51022 RepID=A0A0C2H6T8_9BILA|nr:hypothetical protein ANCDUO_00059 [Ancylostoma duodenale]
MPHLSAGALFLLKQLDATNCLGITSFAQTHNCAQGLHENLFYPIHHQILKKEVLPGIAAGWVRPRQPVPSSQEFHEEMDRATGVWIMQVDPKEQLLLEKDFVIAVS